MTWLGTGRAPAQLFLIIGALFSILWALITPPFQAPDENRHFCRAYQLSDGRLFAIKHENTMGDSLPVSVIETMDRINPGMAFHSRDQRQDLDKVWHYLRLPLQAEEKAFYEFSASAIYPPPAYLPAIVAIWIGKTGNVSPLVMMYLGRFAHLALWLVVMVSALRLTPTGKWVMALIALMPMSIFLAGAVHQDGFINAFCFLLLACTLKFAHDPGVLSRPQYGGLFLLTLVIAFSKPGFALFAVVFLLLPAQKFASRRRQWMLWILMVLAALAITWGWKSLAQQDLNWLEPWASYDKQSQAVVASPMLFIGAALRSFWVFKLFYIRSHVGQLGWLDTLLPLPIIAVFLLLIAVAAVLNHEGSLSVRQRIVLALVVSGVAGVTALALYLVNSPVGDAYVHGISGRYFIPAAPFFWLLFQNHFVHRRVRPGRAWILAGVLGVVVSLAWASYILIERYYL